MASASYERFRKWCHERGARLDQPLQLAELDDRSLSLTLTDFVSRRAPQTQLDALHSLGRDKSATDPQGPAQAPATAGAGLEHSLASQRPGSPSLPGAAAQLPEPTTRYVVLHAIAGGMGLCCFCFDHEADFPFVIKTFRADRFLRSASTLPEFLREVAVWTKLGTHANLVRAYGVRLIQCQPYLFLEFIDGPTVRERIAQLPLANGDVVELLLQTCRALRHARNCTPGFVHGDLKPSNLLLGPRWLKVTDFGLARSGSDALRGPAGTPAYMAPELWQHGPVTGRTDVYALGVVAWEALTGRRPLEGETAEELERAHLSGRLGTLGREHRPLEPLLRACLARDAADRPTLLELWVELRRLRKGRRLQARLFAAERGRHAQRQRMEFQFEQFRKRRAISGALEFGDEFGGGVADAIRSQLDALDELSEPELTHRLWVLSALHTHCPEAFSQWNADHLELAAESLRSSPLPGLFAPLLRLPGADLRGAQLPGAFLAGAQLPGATLDEANLRKASLAGADLRETSLRGADLRYADLGGARLEGARLDGAQLEGVRLVGSTGVQLPPTVPISPSDTPVMRRANLTNTAWAVRADENGWQLRGGQERWSLTAASLEAGPSQPAPPVTGLLAWTSGGFWVLQQQRRRILIEDGARSLPLQPGFPWQPPAVLTPSGSHLGLVHKGGKTLRVFDTSEGLPWEPQPLAGAPEFVALAPEAAALARPNLRVMPFTEAAGEAWQLSLLSDGCDVDAADLTEVEFPVRLHRRAAAARAALQRWGHRHQGILAPAHALAFAPQGRLLAARGLCPDPLQRFGTLWMEAIHLYDQTSGHDVELPDRGASLDSQPDPEQRGFLAFSPTGRWLASYRSDELSLWEPEARRLLLRERLPELRCLAFAPGERLRLACLVGDPADGLVVFEARS